MYDDLAVLDTIHLNLTSKDQFIINIALAIIMYGVALGFNLKKLRRLLHNKRLVLIGFTSQFILLPALTYLFAVSLGSNITVGVALGMLLVASCPGGNVSNFMTSLSKGNIELSVTLTAIATISAVIMTPVNFSFWGNMYAKHSDLVRPIEIPFLQMAQTVFLILGIPLILGVISRKYLPVFSSKIEKPIRIFSILFLIALILGAFFNNFSIFLHHIKWVFILVLIHNALAFTSAYLYSRLFKTNSKDRRTISIETGIQNSGLAIVLILNPKIFPPDVNTGGMLTIAAWWGIWHIVAGFLYAWFWNYNDKRKYQKIKKQRLLLRRKLKNT